MDITQENYELEYWHNQEYIDSVVDKSFSPKSFTLNPVYNTNSTKGSVAEGYKDKASKQRSSANSPSITHRYQKRADTINTSQGQSRQGQDHSSNRARSQRQKGTKEHTQFAKQTLDDKYVATATGSNFYSYEPQTTEPFTNLDDDSASEHDVSQHSNGSHGNGGGSGSSFKTYGGNGARKKRRSAERRRYLDNDGDRSRKDSMEVYAVSYKDRLKKNLDNWSAEESDV